MLYQGACLGPLCPQSIRQAVLFGALCSALPRLPGLCREHVLLRGGEGYRLAVDARVRRAQIAWQTGLAAGRNWWREHVLQVLVL